LRKICVYSILLLLASCANIQAPSGGPPDTTPPKIIETKPANKATNFRNDRVILKFDKYMNKNSVIENTYIQPITKAEFDWSGKELEIIFKDNLLENTTYTINLGTEYSDFYNNKPQNSFTLIFSTGNQIDTGTINGVVTTAEPHGLYVFAYKITNLNPDTVDFYKTTPNYRVQVGSSGEFSLQGLADGKYRLILVKDVFKDVLINENQDFYSTAYQDLEIKNSKSQDALFRFGKIADNSPPKLFFVESFTKRKIKLFFSENIILQRLDSSSIFIIDSLQNKIYSIDYFYLDNTDKNVLILITKDTIQPKNKLHLSIIDTNAIILDTVGNKFNEFYKTFSFITSVDEDQSEFHLLSVSIKDSSINIPIDKEVALVFTEPISKVYSEIIEFINIDDSLKTGFTIELNKTKLNFKPNLQFGKNYLLKIPSSSIVPAFGANKFDEDIILHFRTESNINSGNISGVVIDSTGNSHPKMIVLESIQERKLYQVKADSSGRWSISNIKPGDYNVWIYEDRNKNSRYDFGNLKPFEFAEKFYPTGKIVTVRSRWETEGITLRIGK